MSPEKSSMENEGEGGTLFETNNMVLSTIPLENGHVMMQSHQQLPIDHNNQLQGTNSHEILTTKSITTTNQTTPSRYVIFHSNGIEDCTIDKTTATTIGQNNNIGNIVFVTAKALETTNNCTRNIIVNTNGNDEELTSLTWLHDKNLLKDIVACTNNDNNNNNKSSDLSPIKHINGGTITPTSDFLDDSCVSEDNLSSANSSSDQGISINTLDFSSIKFQTKSHHIDQKLHHNSLPISAQSQKLNNNYNYNNNNNNNNISYYSSSAITTSLTTFSNQQLNSINSSIKSLSTIEPKSVHVGHDETKTLVELKTNQNYNSTSNALNLLSTVPQTSTPITSSHHQHFHKKYIREQINGYEQDNGENIVDFSQKSKNIITPISKNISLSESENLRPPIIQAVPVTLNNNINEEIIDHNKYDHCNYTLINTKTTNQQKASSLAKQKHPSNLPYDPLINIDNKPPYSFSSLIFMAIEDSPDKALPVKEIYSWIIEHFPYFKTAPTGWKNSVRHNLSLNKSFLKVEKAPNMGKGSLWRVELSQRPNLIQALTRSPYFPCSALKQDSKLFPKLTKMIGELVAEEDSTEAILENTEYQIVSPMDSGYYNDNQSNYNLSNSEIYYDTIERIARDCGADNLDDVNAAAAMLALKHGHKAFGSNYLNGLPVITSSPSEDHTYSAGGGGCSSSSGSHSQNVSDKDSLTTSSDCAYDSSEDSLNNRILAEELEEQRRHAEGVDALLTFASKASSFPSSDHISARNFFISNNISDEPTSPYSEETVINTDYDENNSYYDNNKFVSTSYSQNLTLTSPPMKRTKINGNLLTKLKRKVNWNR